MFEVVCTRDYPELELSQGGQGKTCLGVLEPTGIRDAQTVAQYSVARSMYGSIVGDPCQPIWLGHVA